ncbi:MAG: RcnB family protein [Proteobacteria bacterium]|nr:RcnB family protein [Pseudomonadota bacterium]
MPGAHPPRARDRGRSWFQEGRFPESFFARHHYRGPSFYPRGWYYQRWSYGMFLPFGWFASNYYLDWAAYDLPAPPIGCEWVRQGNDAVLVDVYTGEVLSVYYDVFW